MFSISGTLPSFSKFLISFFILPASSFLHALKPQPKPSSHFVSSSHILSLVSPLKCHSILPKDSLYFYKDIFHTEIGKLMFIISTCSFASSFTSPQTFCLLIPSLFHFTVHISIESFCSLYISVMSLKIPSFLLYKFLHSHF